MESLNLLLLCNISQLHCLEILRWKRFPRKISNRCARHFCKLTSKNKCRGWVFYLFSSQWFLLPYLVESIAIVLFFKCFVPYMISTGCLFCFVWLSYFYLSTQREIWILFMFQQSSSLNDRKYIVFHILVFLSFYFSVCLCLVICFFFVLVFPRKVILKYQSVSMFNLELRFCFYNFDSFCLLLVRICDCKASLPNNLDLR